MASIIASNALHNHLIPSSYVESVYLYNSHIDLILSTRNGEQSSLDLFYDKDITSYLYDTDYLLADMGKPITHSVTFNGQERNVYSYILFEMNKEKTKVINALVINIKVDVLIKSIQDISSQDTLGFEFLVLDSKGNVTAKSPDINSELISHITNKFSKWIEDDLATKLIKVKTIYADTYLALINNENKNGWHLIGLVPRDIVFKDITYATVLSILILILTLFACAFVCLYLAKKLHSPIKAITNIVKGENVEKEIFEREIIETTNTTEFKFLASVFSTMKEQNLQFEKFKNETDYPLRKLYLSDVICGVNTLSTEKVNELGIKYMIASQLCLCILKIDDYKTFLVSNNQRERWALRYTIISISKNILAASFQCEVFNIEPDRFVVIINCKKENNYKHFTQNLECLILNLQKQIHELLDLSLTIAYSNFFKGIENLSDIYNSVDNLIKQKIIYGNGRIINTEMVEDNICKDFNYPILEEEKLVEEILSGELEDAITIYNNISNELHKYNYDEIISYFIHLSYIIYSTSSRKYPPVKENLTSMFKSLMINITDCEILDDINNSLTEFIVSICEKISFIRETQVSQTAEIVVSKVISIIENNFTDKELCLNTIADEVGLSPTYVGYLFKTVEDKSVAKYISDYRMEKVAHYIKTTRYSTAKILELVGIEKSNYFYTIFKDYFGMPLGKYRLTVANLDNTASEQ